jgi:DNA-binding beta-propeller fold protein YncE
MSRRRFRWPIGCVLLAGIAALFAQEAVTETQGIAIPTGQTITPTAADGAIFQDLDPEVPGHANIRVNEASRAALSPDGHTLAILTSGNQWDSLHVLRYAKDSLGLPPYSEEYVFLFDVTGPSPRKVQVLKVGQGFLGFAWHSSSRKFYVSGGTDDVVREFVLENSLFERGRSFSLGHKGGAGMPGTPAVTAGIAISPDGRRLLVANLMNDSVSLVDLDVGRVVSEQDLRPGVIDAKNDGKPGGSYPRSVAWISQTEAYVGSERDREVISLRVVDGKIKVIKRLPVPGQPVALLANRKGTRLFVALDNTDQVAIFDTRRDALIESLSTVAPPAIYANAAKLGGANPNGLALSHDERTLFVSNGGENAVAVAHLNERAAGVDAHPNLTSVDATDAEERDVKRSSIIGLVPTGWYPTDIAVSKSGDRWFVVNAKSPAGPNVSWCKELAEGICHMSRDLQAQIEGSRLPPSRLLANGWQVLSLNDQADDQLSHAGLLALPAPSGVDLARLTKQVARNNRFDNSEEDTRNESLFSFLHEHIRHVIYVIKENRTYDQILGDLEVGNGDPRFAIFPEKISPNHHAIARAFVTLDNFLDSGSGSADGWDFSTAARVNDFGEHSQGAALGRGLWGTNRGLNVGLATSAERHADWDSSPTDPNLLPGAYDVGAADGPGGEVGTGYIWDAALRRRLSVRNYGFFEAADENPPAVRDPFVEKRRMISVTRPSLIPNTDLYYRGWDTAYPDYWRYQEWRREFEQFVSNKSLPNLMLVELGGDHTGSFDKAIDGVNTPETQVADNDYALGMILEAVSNSPFNKDTLIVSLEDDAWDGADHVDAFRSVALFAGPYVKRHTVVSTRYTTVSVVKTIEEILGIGPIGLNDALAAPMSDLFDPNQAEWSYKATIPDVLRSTQLPLPPSRNASIDHPKHSAAYWARAMAAQDFSGPDRVDPTTFNRALWRGLKGNAPYPSTDRWRSPPYLLRERLRMSGEPSKMFENIRISPAQNELRLKIISVLALLFAFVASASAAHTAQSSTDIEPSRCAALAGQDYSNTVDAPQTQVRGATVKELGGDSPAYCLVEGQVTPLIQFELHLPLSHWNGKFLVTFDTPCGPYLKRGYACMPMYRNGFKGQNDDEASALQLKMGLEAWIESLRSNHLLTVAGKTVVDRFYSKSPERSYFAGCSAGGYSAVWLAQNYPWDFDGVIAGELTPDPVEWLVGLDWVMRHLVAHDEKPVLSYADRLILHSAVVMACGTTDSLSDGLIVDPLHCSFDPSKLLCRAGQHSGCLSAAQVNAVKQVYAGPTSSSGLLLSHEHLLPGSELSWDQYVQDSNTLSMIFAYDFYGTSPAITPKNWDFDRDYKRIGMTQQMIPALSPDLRRFNLTGGKIIAYQGGNDTQHTAGGMADYYEMVERVMGGEAATKAFLRLFVVPGMNHCSNGEGPYAIDYLSYLEKWVEQAIAPDVMIGSHIEDSYFESIPVDPQTVADRSVHFQADLPPAWKDHLKFLDLNFPLEPEIPVSFTRPIYPYPLHAEYRGVGDPRDAANFEPVGPSQANRTTP